MVTSVITATAALAAEGAAAPVGVIKLRCSVQQYLGSYLLAAAVAATILL
jgi:hypothetical protein